LIKYFLLAAV